MFEYAGHECTLFLSPSMVFNLKWYFGWKCGISPKGRISAPSCHPNVSGVWGSNDVNVLCSWARQLRQIFAAIPEKFGGPDARGERCALLGGQQLWYLGIDWSVQVPRRCFFFVRVLFFGSLPIDKFCFLKWYCTPWFFCRFLKLQWFCLFNRFFVGFQALSSSMLYVWVLMDLFAPTWANFFATTLLPNCDVKETP